MKTRLLKKIRDKHPIYFNTETKLYQYITVSGRLCSGGVWERDYESEWIKDYKIILERRRELIVKDAKEYFFNKWFCYKRKRPLRIYRAF